jgi:hypothetical protein
MLWAYLKCGSEIGSSMSVWMVTTSACLTTLGYSPQFDTGANPYDFLCHLCLILRLWLHLQTTRYFTVGLKPSNTYHWPGKVPRGYHKMAKTVGLKVNRDKIKVCPFCRHDVASMEIKLGESKITFKSYINVFSVLFNANLRCSQPVSHTISKANKSLNAITIVWKFFNIHEPLNLVASNVDSILYYNSDNWNVCSFSK